MFDKNAKIYVAGHTGLLGSAFVKILTQEGYNNILVKTHQELDLTDKIAVEQFFQTNPIDYVLLCAGKVGGIVANKNEPASFLHENLAIQDNIFEAANKAEVQHVLFFGSSCTYPKECSQPMREEYWLSGPIEQTSKGYAAAKIAGILGCQAYNEQYNTNRFICLIPNSIYGPNDNFDPENSHVFSALIQKIHKAKQDNQTSVTLWGSGNPRREFIFSEDVVNASIFLLQNADKLENNFYNLGANSDYSIKELAQIIAIVVGFEGEILWDTSKPDGAMQKTLDSTKLMKLGWNHYTDFEDALKKTYEWYKKSYNIIGLGKRDAYTKQNCCNNLLIIPKSCSKVFEDSLISIIDTGLELILPSELEEKIVFRKDVKIKLLYDDIFSSKNQKLKKFEMKTYKNIYYIVSSNDLENKRMTDFMIQLKADNFFSIYQNRSYKNITEQLREKITLVNTSYISPLAQINDTVKIGTENYIADKVTIDDYTTIKERVKIGRCTGISTHVHIYNDCNIGSFSAIGANSVIAAPPHHIDTFTISNKVKFSNLEHQYNASYIGNDVWIGANVTIAANVTIGDGAVIGANSFVNKDVPPYAIAFGVPAKVFRYRFNDETIEELKMLEWWNIENIEDIEFDSRIEKAISSIQKDIIALQCDINNKGK